MIWCIHITVRLLECFFCLTIIAIQRTQRLPQWVGQLARVPQVFISKVPKTPKTCQKFASHQMLLDFRRLRAPSYFVSSETEEVGGPFTLSIATFRLYCDINVKLYTIESIAWEQTEPPHPIVGSGSDVALPVQEARIHNIHCRPVEGCRHNLLQGRDGDRGKGVRDQVRHCPRLLPG